MTKLEQKKKAISFFKKGFTFDEIAKKVGVSKTTISRWMNEYEELTEPQNPLEGLEREYDSLDLGMLDDQVDSSDLDGESAVELAKLRRDSTLKAVELHHKLKEQSKEKDYQRKLNLIKEQQKLRDSLEAAREKERLNTELNTELEKLFEFFDDVLEKSVDGEEMETDDLRTAVFQARRLYKSIEAIQTKLIGDKNQVSSSIHLDLLAQVIETFAALYKQAQKDDDDSVEIVFSKRLSKQLENYLEENAGLDSDDDDDDQDEEDDD